MGLLGGVVRGEEDYCRILFWRKWVKMRLDEVITAERGWSRGEAKLALFMD